MDILDKEQIKASLSMLGVDTVPLWGKMKPQQMVEHMVESLEYSNGKEVCACDRTAEEAEAAKRPRLHPDFVIPRNVNLGPLPDSYRFANLKAAVTQLLQELDDFDVHFKLPGTKSVHIAFGPMDREEWLIWHGKHFTHHFKQFELLR